MIITEGVQPSPRLAGVPNAPGIWSQPQIESWRRITDAVHAKGGFMWCQLWAPGRASDPSLLRRNGQKFISSSAVPLTKGGETPEEMSEEEIVAAIQDFETAAKNAMAAGFDGIEVHAGNGYLIDQFLQSTCNQRTDGWGGSKEKRAKFAVEIVKAVARVVGSNKTAIRVSPWSDFNAMGMSDADTVSTFTHLIEELRPMKLGFVDLIEARIRGNDDADCGADKDVSFLVKAWQKASPVLLSGGFTSGKARKAVDESYPDQDVAIIFGRYWTSNPDLVFRIKENIELVKYDRSTFYTAKSPVGYTDFDYSEQFKAATAA